MQRWIMDTAGLGTAFWLIGYIASLVLFFSPFYASMGWILLVICTPITVAVTWWWFRDSGLPLIYFAGIGLAWTALAIVFDYLFIVLLFNATYYGADVFIYYLLTFLIPVFVGQYLSRNREKAEKPDI